MNPSWPRLPNTQRPDDSGDLSRLSDLIYAAMADGVASAIRRHLRNDQAVTVWRHGRLVQVRPDARDDQRPLA